MGSTLLTSQRSSQALTTPPTLAPRYSETLSLRACSTSFTSIASTFAHGEQVKYNRTQNSHLRACSLLHLNSMSQQPSQSAPQALITATCHTKLWDCSLRT